MLMQHTRIRKAEPQDLGAIRRIYNHYVLSSTATFDTVEQTEKQRQEWYQDHLSSGLPMLVADNEGEVIGWGSLSFYHARCAYKDTVEPSLYVAPDHLGQGVGKRLFQDLLASARQSSYHCVVGLICSENVASLKLVQSFGFRLVGNLQEVGRKFDRWLDVTIVQKSL